MGDALVSKVAVSGVQVPVPVVVQTRSLKRPIGDGAEPAVVVDRGRDEPGPGVRTDGPPRLVAQTTRAVNRPEAAVVNERHRVSNALRGPPLRSTRADQA